jgi:predicted secreted protein
MDGAVPLIMVVERLRSTIEPLSTLKIVVEKNRNTTNAAQTMIGCREPQQ